MLNNDVLAAAPATAVPTLDPARADVDQAATISAIEMSRLTGIGRERLRTWERRHGFPTPVRAPNNVRRYLAADVRRVLAVARLVEAGVPLAEAIESRPDESAEPASMISLGATLDDAPMPAIAVSGPAPLTVAWANTATVKSPESITVGDALLDAVPEFGPRAVSQLQQLMVGSEASTAVIEHLDWIGTFPTLRRSVAWRLSPQASSEAIVVLVQLTDDATTASGAGMELVSQQTAWATAVRCGGDVLRQQTGLTSVQRAIAQVVRHTGAIDGFIATCREGSLRTASSVRGAFTPRTVDVAPHDPTLQSIRDGELDWLDAEARRPFDPPCRSQMLVVPMTAGGHTIGGLFLVYPEELALCDITRELLRSFATSLAITLQREHFSQRRGSETGEHAAAGLR